MINFDDVIKEETEENNPNWSQIPDHPYRILTIRSFGSEKTFLINLLSQQPDTDKIYLYSKDLYKSKYEFLINKRENTGLKHLNDSKALLEYSNDMDNIYRKTEEYNRNKKRRTWVVFSDMIAEKVNSIVTELFARGWRLNFPLRISSVNVTNPYYPADLDTFTEEILNWKLHFLCSDISCFYYTITF